jgi:hypothetical protein
MSNCVANLRACLLDDNKVEAGNAFHLLREIARERKFSGDDLDGLIADALKDCTLEHLDRIDANAKALLPQGMLADSMRLGIARMLLPMNFVAAVMQEAPERWSIAGDLRNCCNPAKRGDGKPTEAEAKLMIQNMLVRVLDRLPPWKLALLNQTAPFPQNESAMLVLKMLLEGKYAQAIADAETNI